MSTHESAKAFFDRHVPTMSCESFQERYRLGTKLGSGVAGTIKQAIELSTGKSFGVKIIDKAWVHSRRDPRCNAKTVQAEIVIHASLRHPNIAKFHEAVQDNKNFYIVMELCGHGTLHSRLEKPQSLQSCLTIVKPIFETVRYIQSRGVAHRDIPSFNILFDGDHVKLIDFDLSVAENREHLLKRFSATSASSKAGASSSTASFRKDAAWDTSVCGKYLDKVLNSYKLHRRQKKEPKTKGEGSLRKAMKALAIEMKRSKMNIETATAAVQ